MKSRTLLIKGKAGLISGFHCSVNEICAHPVFYAA
jgi:hypothetical protein